MQIVHSIEELPALGIHNIAVAVGVFDGVHIGHRKLLSTLCGFCEMHPADDGGRITPVAVTFMPHPRSVLFPDSAPPLLLPPEEKYHRLFESGAAAIVELHFDKAFSRLEPGDFITRCLSGRDIRLHGLCVGTEWHFGADGKGDSAFLSDFSRIHGFHFLSVPEVERNGETVSSTTLRLAAQSGDFDKFREYCGSPCMLFGPVIHGNGVASTKLDHPTANMDVQFGVLPPCGVYAAFVQVNGSGELLESVVNIGYSPTFSQPGVASPERVEVHILRDLPHADLYGSELALIPVQFLRAERKFDSAEDLRRQIFTDVQTASDILRQAKESFV